MKCIILQAIRINANYYSFISGLMVAVAVNLYTGIFSGEEIPTRCNILLLSSLLTFISAVCWIVMSWKFDPIQKMSAPGTPDQIISEHTYSALLAGKEIVLILIMALGIVTAALGMIVLSFGY